jgi:hypothetical protein
MGDNLEKQEETSLTDEEIEVRRRELELELLEINRWLQAFGGGWKADVLRIAGVFWPVVMFLAWAVFAARQAGNKPIVLGSALGFIAMGVIGFKFIDRKLVATLKKTFGDDIDS